MSISRALFSVFIVAAALTPAPGRALDRLVTVTGEAKIAATPDMASIRLGVSNSAKSAREASDANAKQMTAVLAAIKDAGIAERDVQTSWLSLQPQYDPNRAGGLRLLGFQASNQVTVKIRELDKIASVLDRAIAAGANEMSGIEFIVSDRGKLLDKARGDAIADARRKAELYARAAGAKVGNVAAISEEGAASPVPRPMQALRAGASVPVAPGEQTLRTVLMVSYELTP